MRLARRVSRLVATVPRLHLRRGEQQAPGQAEQGNLRQPREGQSRQQLARQADFYGAMDGASRFVKG
ncbi:MAG: FHIPEP family type III secretion protein, partial [Planctomycetaceae bacterium]